MNFPLLTYKNLQYILVIIVGVFFIISVVLGFYAGQKEARVELNYYNAMEIKKGLGYFYENQDRYPSISEFADRSLMLEYFNTFPFPSKISGACPQVFNYFNSRQADYELKVCLESSTGGGVIGWNVFNAQTNN